MLKFRFSNISTGVVLFLSPILLVGMYILLSAIYSLNGISNPLPIEASIQSLSVKKEVVGMPKNSMNYYQVVILNTNEFPCSFNLGEIKDSSYFTSLSPQEKVLLFIKQSDKGKLSSDSEIEIIGLNASETPILSKEKTMIRMQQGLNTRINLSILAIGFVIIILGFSGFRRE